jgi:hypothetical protein
MEGFSSWEFKDKLKASKLCKERCIFPAALY